jgi:putative DNA primase/helicase
VTKKKPNSNTMFDRIPQELKEIPQWVMWKWETRQGKPSKPPYQIDGKTKASPTNPEHWITYREAVEALERVDDKGKPIFSGFGFALTGDLGLVAWDLDHCIDPKSLVLDEFAQKILDQVPSYTEVTPSGTGLRIILRGDIPADGKKSGNVECYKDKRYVTITGNHYPNTPEQVLELDCTPTWYEFFDARKDAETKKKKKNELTAEKIELLKAGNYEEAGYNRSEADLALCNHFATITNGDKNKMDSLFRETKLFRDKWDKRHSGDGRTYGQMTIDKALEYFARPHLTDTGNARRLADIGKEELRYVAGKWYIWDGLRLKEDKMNQIYLYADRVTRQIREEAANTDDADRRDALLGWANQLESRSRTDSMLKLAQSRQPLPIDINELDKNLLAFNCESGVIIKDSVLPHSFEHLITKYAPCKLNLKAEAPLWEKFLEWCLPEPELRSFVQRMIGYSMTGDVSEQALFFLYGTGANGKSTLLNAIMRIFGDYAREISTDVFISKNNESHPTALMDLQGVRLAVCPELEDGKRFNEQSLKWITGGERIKARRLFQDFVEFRPTAKIWIVGNHKPVVRGTDYAIWRRIYLVPFTQKMPDDKKDGRYITGEIFSIHDEWEGILNWCYQGYLSWLEMGLAPPSIVKLATEEYRLEQDVVGQFLNQECEMIKDSSVTHKELYARYAFSAKENNEFVMSSKQFSMKLQDKGFEKYNGTGNVLMWKGLSFRDEKENMSGKVVRLPQM